MERWKKNLWTLWVTQIISLMSFGFGLPFLPLYVEQLEVMSPERLTLVVSLISASAAVTMGIMSPIWGYLADRLGRKLMIMRAMIFAIFIIGGMAFAQSANQLIILRFGQGLLTGTVTAALAFVASNTPTKHLTYALGVISSSTFIGYSFGPMLGGLFAKFFGYRMSFIFGAILMAIGALLVLFLVKEDKALLVKKVDGKHISIFKKYKKIMMPTVVTVLVMLFLLRVSRTLLTPYFSLFVKENLIHKDNASVVTGLFSGLIGISTATASIIVGKVAGRLNKNKLLRILLILAASVMLVAASYKHLNVWLPVHNPLWLFMPFYMLFYFFIGGIEPLLTSTSAETVDSEDRGALFGIQGMVGSMAWAVSPMMAVPVINRSSLDGLLYVIPLVVILNLLVSSKLRKKTLV